MELNRIYNENCLDTLARMPDGFLQCVVTSPPYYGLRSYKTEPQIWDGDAKCQHVWGDEIRFSKQDARSAEQKREQGAAVGGSITFNDVTTTGNSGNFCKRCNSWRGELGLEPTFDCHRDRNADLEIRDDLTDVEKETLVRELLALGLIR